MSMIKKSITAGLCLVAICLFFSACGSNKPIDNRGNNKISLDKDEILRISISTYPSLFQTFDITDTGQISTVADYFNSLNPIETKLNPNDYLGMTYNVRILLKDSTERVFNLGGNMFITEKGNFKYQLPYEEANKFNVIVASILETNQSQTGEASIVGTVISVNADESGHNIACVIEDKDNRTVDIDLNNAKIIDTTGTGWLILHEKDVVKVFYLGDTLTDARPIVAATVYIKNVALDLKQH